MSLERVLKTLESLGLSRVESEVYIYLAKAGPSKAEQLAAGLRMTNRQVYPVLNDLKKKKIVLSKPKHTRTFSAIAFEELLNLFVRLGTEKTKIIRETKQELTDSWQEMTSQDDKS